jgi:hypothetical protein
VPGVRGDLVEAHPKVEIAPYDRVPPLGRPPVHYSAVEAMPRSGSLCGEAAHRRRAPDAGRGRACVLRDGGWS